MVVQLSHISEWDASRVDADITTMNVEPIHGTVAFERLYGHAVKRLQTGGNPLNSFWMRKYREFETTDGWWVCGVDPLNNFARSKWGRYKPTTGQIFDKQKGKPAKYLSPAKQESHPIFLDVPSHVWAKIALLHGLDVDFGQYQNFWQWVMATPSLPIYITEGEKKAGALLTAGYAAISTPGIWMGTRKNVRTGKHQLVKDLIPFDVLERQINVVFDYEADKRKARNIDIAATRLGYAFKSAKVSIGYLPGPQKGIDDYLVSGGSFEDIKFKTLNEIKANQQWGMNYHPDILLNQQYLNALPLPPTGLICIKSPMGTGKTTLLNPIVAEAFGRGQKVISISHRINLANELCNKINLPYIAQVRNHYIDESGKVFKFGRFAGFGLCIDSLHPEGQGKINPKDWEGAIVILDEFDQILWHLLNSNTCRHTRVKILETFKELIEVVLSTGGRVIAMDAQLSDLSINFLRSLSGYNIKPFIVRNDWKPTDCWEVRISSGDDASALLKKVVEMLNQAKKVILFTDSQKVTSTWGTINLEEFFKRECPNIEMLSIDSENMADPNHPAYGIIGNVNESLKQYALVICSPSISSGVSIDIRGHFAEVFGIFQGSITVNDCLQSLARVREAVPRSVWVAKRAVSKIAGGSLSPTEIINNKNKDLQAVVRLLNNVDVSIEENTHQLSLKIWAYMIARVNAAGLRLRESLISRLKDEGHNVEFFFDTDGETLETLKTIKKENIDKEAVEVVNAADCTEQQFEELQKKHTKTKAEQRAEKKHALGKTYGKEQICEALKKLNETRGWYAQLRLYYYLTLGRPFVNLRDTLHLEGHKQRGAGKVCVQDIKTFSDRVTAYEKLGFLDFTDGRELTKHDPQVKEVAALCLKFADLLRRLFGVTVTAEMVEKSPVRVIQMFLKLVGLKLTKEKQRRQSGTGERVWVYRFGGVASPIEVENPELRPAIFEHWHRGDVAALAEYEARLADNLGVA